MKIYSTRRKYYKWDLSKFVGKDVWVKCRQYTESGTWIADLYVNIVDEPNFYGNTTDFYSIRCIPAWQLGEGATLEVSDIDSYISRLLNHPIIIRKSSIDLQYINGVDIYSTDEVVAKLREAAV